MTTGQPVPAAVPPPAEGIAPRRVTERGVASAIDLGWRLAALHGMRPHGQGADIPLDSDLLANRASLPTRDRMVLEVRALAGDAARAGLELGEEDLVRLLDLASEAISSAETEASFRSELARCHVAFETELWSKHEGHGKAYEIGNFLSDTWNRVLRPEVTGDSESELLEVFSAARVERMKELLDDLQTRIDPAAVHTVQNHLDAWRDRVQERVGGRGPSSAGNLTSEEIRARYEPVERQTVIWRQLLTGEKEPEAYIDRDKRAEVRDELTRELWKRYSRYWWVLIPVAGMGALVGWLFVEDNAAAGVVAGAIGSVGGALGLTRASMSAAIRKAVQSWGELMWNRSLAAVICRETSALDDLYPPSRNSPVRARARAPARGQTVARGSPVEGD